MSSVNLCTQTSLTLITYSILILIYIVNNLQLTIIVVRLDPSEQVKCCTILLLKERETNWECDKTRTYRLHIFLIDCEIL